MPLANLSFYGSEFGDTDLAGIIPNMPVSKLNLGKTMVTGKYCLAFYWLGHNLDLKFACENSLGWFFLLLGKAQGKHII